MIEIGSEFWKDSTPLDGTGVAQLMPESMDVRYTLCGRTALTLVLQDALLAQPIHKAYLPSYCCHTMIEPFVSLGIDVQFYPVFFTEKGIGMEFDRDNNCDLIYLIDYFGFKSNKTAQIARQQKHLGKCVVYDATQAMFCEHMDYSGYHYVFGSFRKWFAVNAGFCAKKGMWAFAENMKHNETYTDMRNRAFAQKQRFVSGESTDKSVFLQTFAKAEQMLDADYSGYAPDEASLQILASVNIQHIRHKRRENAKYAIAAVNSMKKELVKSPYQMVGQEDCPLFVPLQVTSGTRSALRSELISNRVYLPVHWTVSALHETDTITEAIYQTELSFVCDQRYSREDLAKAINIVRRFFDAC